MNQTIETILLLLQMFFKNNPTVQEVELILPQIMDAITSAKVGTAFVVKFPLSVDAKGGLATFSWVPGFPPQT